jgi:hypothetical protein
VRGNVETTTNDNIFLRLKLTGIVSFPNVDTDSS